jgi:hypothetical protein
MKLRFKQLAKILCFSDRRHTREFIGRKSGYVERQYQYFAPYDRIGTEFWNPEVSFLDDTNPSGES